MPHIVLLSPQNANLKTLTLSRLQLSQEDPSCVIETHGDEVLLYVLVGAIEIRTSDHYWGTFGGRRFLRDPGVQAMRFPAGSFYDVVIQLQGYSADVLVASTEVNSHMRIAPIAHQDDCIIHDVGEATYRREVRVMPTPTGYVLHAGETRADGTWSSWPSHATPEEIARYAEHEEVFFYVSPGYALMHLDGRYCDGTVAQGVVKLTNGEALVTPLGQHPLVQSPDTWGVYVWFYRSFLQKTYNQYATDCTIYVK